MVQSSFICIIFSILILAKGIKNPLTLIMSYPPKIIERAEKLYS
ncbi:hypothetical protein [Brachyspira hampsonii]|nr:hypothetical protein [Brachyspira hampsonii]